MPWLCWHDLRRTFATLADAGKISIGERKELMGHSRAGQTLQYTHTPSEQARGVLEAACQPELVKAAHRGGRKRQRKSSATFCLRSKGRWFESTRAYHFQPVPFSSPLDTSPNCSSFTDVGCFALAKRGDPSEGRPHRECSRRYRPHDDGPPPPWGDPDHSVIANSRLSLPVVRVVTFIAAGKLPGQCRFHPSQAVFQHADLLLLGCDLLLLAGDRSVLFLYLI